MGLIFMFRAPKPRQFKYTPIFYDARKEALQEREKQIKQELGLANEDSPRVSMIKGRIRAGYRQPRREKTKTNLRLLIILIALLAAAYFFFYH